MAQFNIYSSNDVSSVGMITGQAGSLLTILDACLVGTDGIAYGTKPSAGWTKPIANSGNIGCYKQGSGSMCTLVVNDTGTLLAQGAKTAAVYGWEVLQSLTAPGGTGLNRFVPAAYASDPVGTLVWRKSVSADATGRYWILFADSATFYLFIASGDNAGYYWGAQFGDIYSLNPSDTYRALIIGHIDATNAGSWLSTYGARYLFDAMKTGVVWDQYAGDQRVYFFDYNVMQVNEGHFMSRKWSGANTAVNIAKVGDSSKGYVAYNGICFTPFVGKISMPNPPDNGLYMVPINIVEPDTLTMRGRWRGVYQICHHPSNFSDGQTFTGSGDFAGKTFWIVKYAGISGGILAIDISDTLDTN